MKNFQDAIVIGIMCFLLSLGIVVQVSSIKKESTVVAQENTENELRDEVLKINNEYNKLLRKLEKSEKNLDKIRKNVADNNEQSQNWSNELENINNCLGLTKLSGNGIKIEMEDGDLLYIINALNNAGADAIAINGYRITFNADIKTNEDIVSLEGIELKTPYKIEAIGGDGLYNAIAMPGSYIDILKNSGHKVNVTKEESITINKYKGIYNFNYVKNIN